MAATKGTEQASSAEGESADDPGAEDPCAEDPCAVATMTRLIHDLYASNGSYAAIRGGRDSDLIVWSEILSAVRSGAR